MNFFNVGGGAGLGPQGMGGFGGRQQNPMQQLMQLVMGLLMGLMGGQMLGGMMGGQQGGPGSGCCPCRNPNFGGGPGGPGGFGGPGGGAQPFNNSLNNFLGNSPGGGAPGGGGVGGARPANPNAQIPSFGANPSKQQVGQMLDAAAEKYGIPPNILKGVAYQESGWRANASSFDGGHGKGIMQIDDRYHEFARTNAVWDPAQNINYGANYLKSLYEQTGSWEAALKRYNGGSSYPPKIMAHAQNQPWRQWGA